MPRPATALGLLLPAAAFLGPVLRGAARLGQGLPLCPGGLDRGVVMAVEQDPGPLQPGDLLGRDPGRSWGQNLFIA